jgi:gamma-glutamyltranspeptidase/glutathione hydrolase
LKLLALAATLVCAASADAQETSALNGSRSPAFAPDGRLAVSIDGDLYAQVAPGGTWIRLTGGAAWDRDPAWTRDGKAIVFSSDRNGAFNLFRLTVGGTDNPQPERITSAREDDSAPSVAPDGSIAFVRGFGGAARVWIRGNDGTEKRLTARESAEIAPAFSPDGARVAYIQVFETGRRLLVRTIANGRDAIASADRMPEKLAWAPDGQRIAFSTTASTAGRAGIYIAAANASYTNLVASRRGDIAWSPDGKTLAIAEIDEGGPGYNGDPARLGDRAVRDPFGQRSQLVMLSAPVAPDADRREANVMTARDRAAHNTAVLEQVWQRSAKLYFSEPGAATRRAQWEALKPKYGLLASEAKDDDELQAVLHRMLRERPNLREPATGRAAVSSAHPVATEAGLEIFRLGGNAVDAAAAVSFALGVVEPDASGPGGYGQMVISLARLEKPALIDFMSRVPEDAGLGNTSLLVNGRYPSDGPVLANVPGTIAGMHSAFRQYGSGKVTWKQVVAPAIRAAKEGYVISDGLATTLSTEREHFLKYEGSKKLFFPNGKPLVAGDTLKNPDLAWVLEQVAERGADGFYRGPVAQKLVDDLRSKGNAMKISDMSRYFAADRTPVSGMYRGYTIYSSAPPVSGGADLVGKLNLLEQFGPVKPYYDDAASLHAALASWTLVPRGRVADPGLWPVDIEAMTSKDSARVRWSCYNPNRVVRAADLRPDSLGCTPPRTTPDAGAQFPQMGSVSSDLFQLLSVSTPEEPGCGPDHAREMTFCHAAGTTAFVVADNDGNAVSVTQTLGTWGGNFYVSPGLGFIYNDKLLSYSTDPSAYGARLPFARHGSTLAPTIVMRGKRPVFAVGAAGNAWITSAVYETLIGLMDFGMTPQQALELPRFLPGGRGGGGAFIPQEAPLLPADGTAGAAGAGAGGRGGGGRGGAPGPVSIQVEDGFSPEVMKRMRALGYEFDFVSFKGELREGYGAAVAIDGKKVTAGADPRRSGTAGAVP